MTDNTNGKCIHYSLDEIDAIMDRISDSEEQIEFLNALRKMTVRDENGNIQENSCGGLVDKIRLNALNIKLRLTEMGNGLNCMKQNIKYSDHCIDDIINGLDKLENEIRKTIREFNEAIGELDRHTVF